MYKKITTLTLLLLFSINANAKDNKNEDNLFIEKIESGSLFKFADLKSDIISQSYIENKSFYFNIISKNYIPNFRLEYNSGSYSNKSGLMSSNVFSDKDISSIDINLKYGDIVSYYTLKNSYYDSFGLNIGLGIRQYAADIKYNTDINKENNQLNSTIPLSYIDLFYSINESNTASIGTYIKESEFNSHSIKDTSIYFKSNIKNVDNLVFLASYSTSNITLSNNLYRDSLIDTSGVNVQLKYFY